MTADNNKQGSLREYLNVLRRRRWLVLGTALLVVVVAILVAFNLTPIYEATAHVEVQPVAASGTESGRVLESIIDPTRALQTQVELIKSESVIGKAAATLGFKSADRLRESLEVSLVEDTQIVEIRASDTRPESAKDFANALATAYIDFRRDRAVEQSLALSEDLGRRIDQMRPQLAEIEAQLQNPSAATTELKTERDRLVGRISTLENNLQSLPDVEALRRGGGTTITAAIAPQDPARPNKLRVVAMSIIMGLILGVGLAMLADNLDERIRTGEELEELVGAPILGNIPFVDNWQQGTEPVLSVVDEPVSGAAEAYRTLRANLRFISLENPVRTLLVTSAIAEEGKSTTASNLAVAFGQGGTKTILVNADLRQPSAHKLLKMSLRKGLLDALDPDFPLEQALQTNGVPAFRFLSAGGIPPNPTEVLSSARFAGLLSTLSHSADLVIIDAPPILGFGEASALASRVDGILLVVGADDVTRRQLQHASDQLRKAGGNIVGMVLNGVESSDAYGYYYQYYHSLYGDDELPEDSPATEPAHSTPSQLSES